MHDNNCAQQQNIDEIHVGTPKSLTLGEIAEKRVETAQRYLVEAIEARDKLAKYGLLSVPYDAVSCIMFG